MGKHLIYQQKKYQWAVLGLIMGLLLCVVSPTYGQTTSREQLERRLEHLELENSRLRGEINRLRYQIQQERIPYEYREGTMRGTTRSLQEIEQMKNSLERLTR